MKKSLLVFAVSVAAMVMLGTGCTSIEANKVGDQVSVHMPVFVKPTIETKNTEINGSATVHSILGIFTWGPNAQAVGVNYGVRTDVQGGILGELLTFTGKSEIIVRNAAAYRATNSVKADIILAPRYVVTVKDYFIYKSINCTVKGYPGYIKGVKVVDCPKACKAPKATK